MAGTTLSSAVLINLITFVGTMSGLDLAQDRLNQTAFLQLVEANRPRLENDGALVERLDSILHEGAGYQTLPKAMDVLQDALMSDISGPDVFLPFRQKLRPLIYPTLRCMFTHIYWQIQDNPDFIPEEIELLQASDEDPVMMRVQAQVDAALRASEAEVRDWLTYYNPTRSVEFNGRRKQWQARTEVALQGFLTDLSLGLIFKKEVSDLLESEVYRGRSPNEFFALAYQGEYANEESEIYPSPINRLLLTELLTDPLLAWKGIHHDAQKELKISQDYLRAKIPDVDTMSHRQLLQAEKKERLESLRKRQKHEEEAVKLAPILGIEESAVPEDESAVLRLLQEKWAQLIKDPAAANRAAKYSKNELIRRIKILSSPALSGPK